MILYLDTATSDRWIFPRRGIPAPDDSEPHMVRLGWLLEDETSKTASEACHLIRLPPGLRMAGEAAHHTGIYDHALSERGMEMFNVLSEFAEALGKASLVVAHSWQFHKQVLERSFRYVGMPAREWPETACAMIKATDIVQIPKQAPGGGYRWPAYTDCCLRFGLSAERLHDPIEDGVGRVRNVRVFWSNICRAAA